MKASFHLVCKSCSSLQTLEYKIISKVKPTANQTERQTASRQAFKSREMKNENREKDLFSNSLI